MAQPSTLYRFSLDLSDIERGIYEKFEFRTALHPSEAPAYLLTRVIAYALNFQEGLEFSPQGLGDPDVPAIRQIGQNGNVNLWIEIGNPSPKKLHKATKSAGAVKVYTYKDPQVLKRDLAAQYVHKLETIAFYSIKAKALEKIEAALERDNKWGLVYMDGLLTINIENMSEQFEITRHEISNS